MRKTIITIMLTLIALLILFLPVALAAPECLSHREARAIWPRAHIYWHTEHRCWDNKRGGRRYHRLMLSARAEAPPKPAPLKPVIEDERMRDFCCWPPLESLTLFADRWNELPYEWQGAEP